MSDKNAGGPDLGSTLVPTFLRRIAAPESKHIFLCGCGGGFDFVHGMILYPELKRLGKQVTIGSYSFTQHESIGEPAAPAFEHNGARATWVTAETAADPVYCPEVHLCAYLDSTYPDEAPHGVYAYNARDFNVSTLSAFYAELVRNHDIDTIILIDGGSDSLVTGDEADLGDPIEDLTSVSAVSHLEGVPRKMLVSAGLGIDRYNGVSDAASLRAVAELTRDGGFLGALAIEPGGVAHDFYRDCVEFIYGQQQFRSAATGFILSAVEGYYGSDDIPPPLSRKLTRGDAFFIWPLMAQLFAFDVEAVARRSLIPAWIEAARDQTEAYRAISDGRLSLGNRIRPADDLPRHAEMVGRYGVDFTNLRVRDRGSSDSSEEVDELPGADEGEGSGTST